MGTNTNQSQNPSVQWLAAILTDDRRRAVLRKLIEQYELPVIQMGRGQSQRLRKGRTRPRKSRYVNSATT